MMPIKTTIVGTGNVGFHLASQLGKSKDIQLTHIVSREKSRAETLINQLGLADSDPLQVNELPSIISDLIILSVPDQKLPEVIEGIDFPADTVVVHTSGSQPMEILTSHTSIGVLYPFQTFTKSQQVNFSEIPIFIESNSSESLELIQKVASVLSQNVKVVSSKDRQKVHLAAVYACNFTNHLYRIAEEILADADLDLKDLEHLMRETVSKAVSISAAKAQTGPAIRGDENIIQKHLTLLHNQPEKSEVYKLLSNQIASLKEK
ncbi:Rossmann-like and DUF2520 domain-containing protein [Marinoscillum sp.]|uniref:Rossmann-like and DUF2520 domain-containing protein n=1 Tax=Marinoscillum sp. TaxID=2024838 RepID=UPI003BABF705